MPAYEVTATTLNLRQTPEVSATNRVDLLPHGQIVEKVHEGQNGWWLVRTTRHGTPVEGYVQMNYLTEVGAAPPHTEHHAVVPVHLTPKGPIRRGESGGRAFPLNEPGMPGRDGTTPEARVQQLGAILDWLDVEHQKRYLPIPNTTYCNIYAYDVANRAGVYLPRVWWTGKALADLEQSKPVSVLYGNTVTELNANMLCDWFEQHGQEFGWRRTFDPIEQQAAANVGGLGIIVAQRKDLSRSGHITAVIPETPTHQATRVNGAVTAPLQTQAGSSNHQYFSSQWWTRPEFRKFGMWIHD